jgi:small subunit ribosomal protein S10
MSQIPLPSDIRSWCLLKSPHVDKKSREHFSIKTYTRLFILGTTTVEFSTLSDRLNYLDFPSGVQVSSLWLRTGKVC